MNQNHKQKAGISLPSKYQPTEATIIHQISVAIVIIVIAFLSCSKSKPANSLPDPLTISAISPGSGPYATAVTISGSNFGAAITDNIVTFNGKQATVTGASKTTLTVKVPKGAGSGPVSVTANGHSVTGPLFTYTFSYTVSTFAGSTKGYADGQATTAQFNSPMALTIDNQDNIYVADFGNNLIRKITPAGNVSTVAGSTSGYADGIGTLSQFRGPVGITIDPSGNLYVSDYLNNKIRKITPAGLVSTMASLPQINYPSGMGIDSNGTVYFSEDNANIIRKIITIDSVVTVAGNLSGFADGVGAAAKFSIPKGITIDNQGNLFVADNANNAIRKITAAGLVSTIAGGTLGFADGTGAAAKFNQLQGIVVDKEDNIYVIDAFNYRLRKITQAGEVITVAGNGLPAQTDGIGIMASFGWPIGIAIDSKGNLFITDIGNSIIRKITIE